MMSIALSVIAKATIVIVVALLAGWVARHQRASLRHLIFLAAFAVLALLPAGTTILPAVPVHVPLRPMTTGDATGTASVIRTFDGLRPMPAGPSGTEAGRTRPALTPATLLSTVWLGGVLGGLVSVALGIWQIRRVRLDGLPWRDAQTMTHDLARDVGFHRRIDVVVHEAAVGPMTCGIVRPVIVFPPDARKWRAAEVRRALTRELEHVRRSDWLTLCLARAVCAFYWFHPLVWIANRQLSVNAERACDDAVLRHSQAVGYADQLVTLAERFSAHSRRPLLAMANRGDLSTRVRAVLDPRQQRGPAGAPALFVAAGAAVVSVALLAPLRTVASAHGQTPAGSPVRFDVASIKPSVSEAIMNVRALPGRLVADASLGILMQYAYGVQAFQVVGGPGWLTSERYQIEARTGTPANREQVWLMLQALLEDRFRLKTHRDVKELPVFALVSNRGGFTLPAPKEGVCVDSAADAAVEWAGGRMAAPGEVQPIKSRCGAAVAEVGRIHGGKVRMPELVRTLSLALGRIVIDETGFAEPFDLQLDFVPDETTPTMPPPPPGSGISGMSIAQALQQQLGLRLESTKGPVQLIVVDRAERPSPN
jgi:uncharacterized protein (TIGR03435 family)